MKRLEFNFILCIAFLFIGPLDTMSAAERAPAKRVFNLVVRGGAGSFAMGDLNTTLTSIDGYYDWARAVLYPERFIGELSEVPGGFKDWEVEVQWTAWKGLSVGVALLGPVHLRDRTSLSFLYSNGSSSIAAESKVRVAAPVKFNLYYSFRIHSKVNFVINGGLGLNRARIIQFYDWLYHNSDATNVVGSYNFDVTGKKAGTHCGFALEYLFNGRISMLIESQWRFVKIKSLYGTGIYTNNEYDSRWETISSESNSEDGYLYHYLVEVYGYPREELAVLTDPSTIENEVTGLRRAFLDLSGFTFKIGLKIGLF